MPIRSWFSRVFAATACVVALAATGCSKQSDDVTAGAASSKDPIPASPADDLEEFCVSVAALDQTDGTTDPSVVLPRFDSLREAAPTEIRADVNLVSDTLIVNNYPNSADPSMEAAPFDVLDPARARNAEYVETNCQPDG